MRCCLACRFAQRTVGGPPGTAKGRGIRGGEALGHAHQSAGGDNGVLAQRALLPYIVASQTIPILAVAPMVVVWLKSGWQSVAVIAAWDFSVYGGSFGGDSRIPGGFGLPGGA